MQAVILAGGKGTRLKPYTITFPKPLVPVCDYPILEIIIRQLAHAGIEDIVISTGHLASLIQTYFGNGKKWNVSIRYVHEETPLNTAGALRLVPRLDENFIVMNGDILTSMDYISLYSKHKSKQAMATIATTERLSFIDYGVIKTDQDGFLADYIEKPSHPYDVSMGVYVLSKNAVELINEGEALSMPDLFLRIQEKGQAVYCSKQSCYWLDIGRVDDYEKAQQEFPSKIKNLLPGL